MITFPQCALGLVSPEGYPLRKLTTLWANSPILLAPFEGLQCEHSSHGEIAGSYRGSQRSKLAQVWPTEMCRRIVEGIISLIRSIPSRCHGAWSTELSFPVDQPRGKAKAKTGTGRGRGRPRLYPREVIFDCPACRSRRPAISTAHTRRQEPPELCKYWDIEPEQWSCEGCISNKSYDRPDHTGDPSTCRMPDPRAYGQRRRSGPVRDPAIPAVGRAQDRNPVSDDLEFDRDPGAQGSGLGGGLPAQPLMGGAAALAAAPPGGGDAPRHDPLDAIDAREEIVEEADPEAEAPADDGADASAPGSARADRIARTARARAAQLRDVSHQAGGGAQEDWRACDMGKMLAALRSPDAATRRKALQRLHIR